MLIQRPMQIQSVDLVVNPVPRPDRRRLTAIHANHHHNQADQGRQVNHRGHRAHRDNLDIAIMPSPSRSTDGDSNQANNQPNSVSRSNSSRGPSPSGLNCKQFNRMDSNVTDISTSSSNSNGQNNNGNNLADSVTPQVNQEHRKRKPNIPSLTVITNPDQPQQSVNPVPRHHGSNDSSPGLSPTGLNLTTPPDSGNLVSDGQSSAIKDHQRTPMTPSTIYTPSTAASDQLPNPFQPPQRKYSRAHNSRFHRRFAEVGEDEKLVNYYSCALIADILLQGYLYISENFFAFYSNIFGYKTKILIPMCEVISVSKERTAKIIPNAVGIITNDEKYVFGSLLSRETTYRLMQDVWRSQTSALVASTALSYFNDDHCQSLDTGSESPGTPTTLNSPRLDDISESTSKSLKSAIPLIVLQDVERVTMIAKSGSLPRSGLSGTALRNREVKGDVTGHGGSEDSSGSDDMHSADEASNGHSRTFRSSRKKNIFGKLIASAIKIKNIIRTGFNNWDSRTLIVIATILLIVLFSSAMVLIIRLNLVHNRMASIQLWDVNSGQGSVALDRARSVTFKREMVRLTNVIRGKLDQLTELRSTFDDLLDSVERFSTISCRVDEKVISETISKT